MSWLEEYLEDEKRRQIQTIPEVPPGLAGATPSTEATIRGEPKREGWYGGEPRAFGPYGTKPSPEQMIANEGLQTPEIDPVDLAAGFASKPVTMALNKLVMAPLWPKTFSSIVSRTTNPVFHLQYEPERTITSKAIDILRGGDYKLQKYQDFLDNMVQTYPSLENIAKLNDSAWDWIQRLGNPLKKTRYYGQPALWSSIRSLNPDLTSKEYISRLLRNQFGRIPVVKDILPEAPPTTLGAWYDYDMLTRARLTNPMEQSLHEFGGHGLRYYNDGIDTLSRYANAELTPSVEKALGELGYKESTHGNEVVARMMDLFQGKNWDWDANQAIVEAFGQERLAKYKDAIFAALKNPNITTKDIIKIMGPAKTNPSRGPVGANFEQYTKEALPSLDLLEYPAEATFSPGPTQEAMKSVVKSTAGWPKIEPASLAAVLPGPDDAAIAATRQERRPAVKVTKAEKPSGRGEGRFTKSAREWTSEARWDALRDEGPFAIEIVKNQSLRHVRDLKQFYKDDKLATKGLLELESRLMTGPDNMLPAESNNVHAWLRRAAMEEIKSKIKRGKK